MLVSVLSLPDSRQQLCMRSVDPKCGERVNVAFEEKNGDKKLRLSLVNMYVPVWKWAGLSLMHMHTPAWKWAGPQRGAADRGRRAGE